ncbi:MAG: 50S ribosomal protein L21 [Candidatus Anammoxibacter sp.]
MYAVMKDKGKQYKVKTGDNIWLDLNEDSKEGDLIEFKDILVYSNDDETKVGTPLVPNVKVVAEVKGMKKGKKLVIMKFRRRKDSRTKNGHRQKYTEVNIKEIVSTG